MGETLAGKKPRNYAVDFWRFFATLAVCWGHMGSVGFRFVGGVFYPESTLLTSGPVLGVFLVFTGYFLMKSYEGKKLKGLNEGKTPSQLALTYLKSRYIGLWPALFTLVIFIPLFPRFGVCLERFGRPTLCVWAARTSLCIYSPMGWQMQF